MRKFSYKEIKIPEIRLKVGRVLGVRKQNKYIPI